MKRIFERVKDLVRPAVVLTALVVMGTLAGCGGGSGVPQVAGGTYEFTSGSIDGESLGADAFSGEQYVFGEDGSCSYTMAAVEGEEAESLSGSYTQDGNEVKITYDEADTDDVLLKVAGDTLIYTMEYPAVDDDGNEISGKTSEVTMTYTRK